MYGELFSMKQMGLDMGMGAEWNGLFWWCCPHVNPGVSLTWLPSDYKTGECVFCKKKYTFKTREGKEDEHD